MFSLARSNSATRLHPDPRVRTADIEEAVELWLQSKGSRDIQALLKFLMETSTWRTAPSAKVMAELSQLYCFLFAVCANGCIPKQKLVSALISLHMRDPIKFVGLDLKDWA